MTPQERSELKHLTDRMVAVLSPDELRRIAKLTEKKPMRPTISAWERFERWITLEWLI